MQQVKGGVQAAGEAIKGAAGAAQGYRGGGSSGAVPGGGGAAKPSGARHPAGRGAGPAATNLDDSSFHDKELSFVEPVYATRTAIHPAPQRELPQASAGAGRGAAAAMTAQPQITPPCLTRWIDNCVVFCMAAPPQKTMPAYMAKARASGCAASMVLVPPPGQTAFCMHARRLRAASLQCALQRPLYLFAASCRRRWWIP